MLTIGSLFSGIGGLELGLEWAGLGPTEWQVEIDPFCRSVLERHWPNADRFDDVRAVDAGCLRPVDLLCGGFPCQDVSAAGRKRGLEGARSSLWAEFRRLVEGLRPRFVVVENVASGAGAWLPRVRHDLRALRYRTRAYALSAADVGAPHLRERIFVVADQRTASIANDDGVRQPQYCGLEPQGGRRPPNGTPKAWAWTPIPADGPVAHGLPTKLLWERALGNAVVPQCAEVIGRIIAEQIAT